MKTELAERVVLITGAARGLGQAAAEAFAAEGCRLALADVNGDGAVAVAERLPTEARGYAVDVSHEETVNKLIEALLTDFGTVDVLLHCAGIARGAGQMGPDGWLPMQDVALADWNEVVGVNLTGTFLMNRAVARVMIPQGWGRVINVASMSGMIANRGLAGHGPYAASKAGVITLTKILAVEWAMAGVTVNSISPGYMATEMGTRSQTVPGFKELQLDMTPQRRLGDPKEFAQAAIYLASEGAAYVTGHNLVLDGGYTAW